MNLKDYYDMLEKHDWYYSYSDDHKVWMRGNKAQDLLEELAEESEEFKDLYENYMAHVFNGEPKPEVENV